MFVFIRLLVVESN